VLIEPSSREIVRKMIVIGSIREKDEGNPKSAVPEKRGQV